MIAGRERDNTTRQVGRRNRKHQIRSTANLKGSPALQILAFEKDLRSGAGIHAQRGHDGRAAGKGADTLRCLAHHL